MKSRSRTSLLRSLLLSATLMSTIPAGSANARPVWGCTNFISFGSSKGDVPLGRLCITIDGGEGNHFKDIKGGWQAYEICGWRIDWTIYHNGKTWWRDKGESHGCTKVYGSRIRPGNGYAPDQSLLCAELYNTATNTKIDAACIYIEI